MPVPSPHGRAFMTITVLLVVIMLVCPVGRVAGQGGSQSPAQVLQDLLTRYGNNSTITVPQLRSLLAALSQDQSENFQDVSHAGQTTTATPPKTNRSKCLPADTLAIYSIGEQSRLDEQGLQRLCPTLLQQLDAGSCKSKKEEEPSPDPSPRPTYAEGEEAGDCLKLLICKRGFLKVLELLKNALILLSGVVKVLKTETEISFCTESFTVMAHNRKRSS
uniref:Solute carrier family 39 (Zinc transporter), member 14 n=1 Tax=Nothobranchius korthausae TaxID=1143690 RepID=A0A1A8FNT4_9TELE